MKGVDSPLKNLWAAIVKELGRDAKRHPSFLFPPAFSQTATAISYDVIYLFSTVG